MKQAEKLSIAAGTVIMGFAAVIVISLMLHFLDFGTQSVLVYKLGNFGAMLYGVYGITSALIPVYLIVGAILLYVPGWSPRRGSYLIFSILPFFTIAGLEKLCRAFFAGTGFSFILIKYSALVIISALLVAIEYLVFGLILDSAEQNRHNREVLEAMHEEQVRLGELADKAAAAEPAVQEEPDIDREVAAEPEQYAIAPAPEDFVAVTPATAEPPDPTNSIGYDTAVTDESLIFKAPHLEKLVELESADDTAAEEVTAEEPPVEEELPARIGPDTLPTKEVDDLIKDNPAIVAEEPAQEEEIPEEPVEETKPEIITVEFGGLDAEPDWVKEDSEYVPEPGEEEIDIPMPPSDDLYSSDEDAFMADPFSMDDEDLSEEEQEALEAERATYAQEYDAVQVAAEPDDDIDDEADDD
ncbi:MAG: hypothetical protein MJ178_09050, partial [Treponemataceae bacterium]|nr:hypothetical protein [Treponemataceae bacterium]